MKESASSGARLLAVDVGNTNTVLGLYEGDDARPATGGSRAAATRPPTRSPSPWRVCSARFPDGNEPDDVIVASVVPSLRFPLRQAFRQLFGRDPIFVEPGIKTGMPILYEVPQEVGADRIVNAVAAHAQLGGPCIVVDFGTATTFDVVTARGEYAGGVIVPGDRDFGGGALRESGPALARRDPPPGPRRRQDDVRARSSPVSTSATFRSSTA